MKKCFQKTILFFVLAFIPTWIGCGLDAPQGPVREIPMGSPTEPAPTPTAGIPLVPAVKLGPKFSLGWFTSGAPYQQTLVRHLQKDKKDWQTFHADSMITVPWYTPGDMYVEVSDLLIKPTNYRSDPNKPLNLTFSVKTFPQKPAPTHELSIDPKLVSYRETPDGISNLKIEINGFMGLIGHEVAKEEKLTVTIGIAASDSPNFKASIDFSIMTPPANIVFNERSLNEYESTVHPVPDNLKYLETNSAQLSLIQVIEVQNLSNLPVLIDFSTQIKGKLWQRSVWTDPQYGSTAEATCWEFPKTIDTTEVYSSEFALLPLTADLPATWYELLQNNANTFAFITRETKTFGLYAKPNKPYDQTFRTLLKDRSPKEFAKVNPIQTVTFATSCNFKCDVGNFSDSFKTQCTANSLEERDKKRCNERLDLCTKCIGYLPSPNQQASCNDCFNRELMDQALIQQTKGELACKSGWRKEILKTKQGKRGTEIGSIFLEINERDTYAKTFYGDQPREKEQEPGSIPILKETCLQDQ